MGVGRWVRHILLAALVLAGAGFLAAQRDGGRYELLPNTQYDGKFTFIRLRYVPPMGRGFRDQGWAHDYPDAEVHFGKILSELSFTRTYLGGSNILTLDDPELFKYPIAYMSEPGFWTLSPEETLGLRNWLTKGGFLIFDDFYGSHWFNLEARMREVLPDARWVPLDTSHPVFDSFFRIESLDFYHPYQAGYKSEWFGIFEENDPEKRLLVVANYNNDIGDYWEYSDRDWAPIELTNEAYKFGVNYVIYAMTH